MRFSTPYRSQDNLAGAFFPKAHEVTPDYWEYTKWRAAHRVCSAMLQNFSTQVPPLPPLSCTALPRTNMHFPEHTVRQS